MKFCDKLIQLRKRNGFSQEELGEKLNVTRQTVSKWELNQSKPDTDKLLEISKLFNVDFNLLLDDNKTIETVESANMYTIQWDVDSLDWKNLSGTEIALRIVNGAKNGSIILCHNNGLHTAEALPMIFSTLKNRGYEFVPIGELIYTENYNIDSNGRQHQNA